MNSLFIVWSDDFNSGVLILDEQHRGLVSLINSFFFHRGDSDGNIMRILVPTIEMFKSYAKINFLTVEKLMRDSAYPDLGKYEKIHDEMMEAIERIDRQCRSRRDVPALLEFLKNYWLDTIKGKDHDYIKYFHEFYGESI